MMNKVFQYSAILLMASAMGGCFASCDSDNTISQEFNYDISNLKVSETAITFGRNGGRHTINVQSQQTITANSSADWLQITTGTQSEVLKATSVSISASENTTGNDRIAEITVVSGSQSQVITVTQSVDLVIKDVTPAVVPGEGGIVTITLLSNEPCDVLIAEDATNWISLLSTRALNESSVQLQVAGHLGAERSGDVTLRVTSVDGVSKINETVTIKQEGRETSIDKQATAMSIAKQMYPGWNLGNTFEGTSGVVGLGDETGWQPSKTTQEIIDFIKAQGFRSVRIPCSWHRHMDKNSNTIDAAWINRVKEVVDYCMNDGLYVLLNDHYDEGWIETHMDTYDESRAATMYTMWNQVATAFADYDEHLLFAGLNEPNADNQTKTDNLVKYEQVFIDAVRATGANNTYRTLVVQGPSTDIDNTNKYYKTLPVDPSADRLMAEVHFYSPWTFCGLEADASWGKMAYFWGAENHVSGSNRNCDSWNEESYVASQFKKMQTQFFDKGIPVIIGEYGCQWREIGDNQAEHDASVRDFHKTVVAEAINHGCVPMLWDMNYCDRQGTKGTMAVIRRSTPEVWNTYAIEGIQAGASAGVWPK